MYLKYIKISFFLVLLITQSCTKKYNIHNNSCTNYKNSAVIGQSVGGLMSAIILANNCYIVDVYEKQSNYTRNIQWGARQSLIDELTSIDTQLAEDFRENIAKPINGGIFLIDKNNKKTSFKPESIQLGNIDNIPKNGQEIFLKSYNMVFEAKVFESFLAKYLKKFNNIVYHNEEGIVEKIDKELYGIKNNSKKFDLIIIADGANSKNRDILDIKIIRTSPERLQISGVVDIENQGMLIRHLRNENNNIFLTGIMSCLNCRKTWMVADIDPKKIITQDDINKEFIRLFSIATDIELDIIKKHKIYGAVSKTSIKPFKLQQNIVSQAYAGRNVILLGDAVGHNHWSAGGGLHIATIAHIQRLKKLLKDINQNTLNEYSYLAIQDNKAWGEKGIGDFYFKNTAEQAKQKYLDHFG